MRIRRTCGGCSNINHNKLPFQVYGLSLGRGVPPLSIM
jgi:hypothetical protein